MAQSGSIMMVSNDAKRVRQEMYDANNNLQIDKKRKIEKFEFQKINESHNDTTDGADSDEKIPTQLDDVNTDCLRHIFEFLTLRELINVAEAVHTFSFPAAEAFSRRHRTSKIEVLGTSKLILNMCRDEYVRIDGPTALLALEHFGARISHISANFDAFEFVDHQYRHSIDLAILKHCTDSLINFEVHFCIESHFQTIIKPFQNVQHLLLNGCMLNDRFAQLNVWFPNVVTLKLAGIWLSQPMVIAVTFEHLTDLCIINDSDAKISAETIQQILHLNRQLQSLQLRCNYGVEMLQTIAQDLQQLAVLELSTPNDRFASFPTGQKFAFPMVRKFTLHASSEADYVVNMPFSLDNVNVLRLLGFDQFHPLVAKLISSGDQLNRISLLPVHEQYARPSDDDDALQQALRTRRQLNELQLCMDEFQENDLKDLIRSCKNLKKLRLTSLNYNGSKTAELEDEWTVYKNGPSYHYVNMRDADYGFECQLFHYVCMHRK